MKKRYLFSLPLIALISLNLAPSVQAAEEVILIYSVFRKPISVPELSQLAETGETSSSLRTYLKLANQSPESLQQTLNKSVEVDGFIFPTVLNSFVGNTILDRVSEVVHPSSPKEGRNALREALLESAKMDNNVRVIEVLENYPNRKIYVEGERLAELYTQIQGVVDQLPRISL